MQRKQAKLPAHKSKGVGNDIYGDARLALARRVATALEPLSVTWFLDGGTLLGAYRTGEVLPQDDDFDMAVYLPDYRGEAELIELKASIEKAIPAPHLVRIVTSYAHKIEVYDPSSLCYPLPTAHYMGADFHAVTVDLQIMTDGPNDSVVYLHNMLSDVAVPKEAVRPTKKVVCEGVAFNAPNEILRFLEAQYGYLGTDAEYDPQTKRYVKLKG